MKILLLNTWRVINSKDGTEKVFCNMANALVESGHRVLAVACENKKRITIFSSWIKEFSLLMLASI